MNTYRRAASLTAAAFAAVMLLGACANDAPTGAPAAPAPAVDNGDRAEGGAAPPFTGDGNTAGKPNEQPQTQVEPQQRSLVYTGQISVKVDDVVKSANDASAIATAAGGIVAADRRNLDADRSDAQLVLRVPSERFQSTLDGLARLGNEESRAVQTDDVTEQIIDLDARVATQQASLDRIRALYARAQTIAEITSIESELSRREADLNSLKQRRERLGGLVALSTITVNLRAASAPAPVQQDEETGFLAGLKNGWKAFLVSVKALLAVAGFLLPWVLAIGVPLWIILGVRRRKRRRAAAQIPPPPPALTPLPPAPPVQ